MEAQDSYAYATDVGYDANSVNPPSADPFAGLDEQQRAQLEEELRQELAKTEEEIATLKQVLASKTKQAQELKRKLGISAWKEWTTDIGQGVKNLQETTAYKDVSTKVAQLNTAIHSAPIYQKTSEALSGVTEKTSSLFGGIGGSLAKKLGDVKSAGVFKSFEATVGTVKSKMTGSRSNSTNSFEEALNSMEQQRQQQAGGVPPTIPEANGSS